MSTSAPAELLLRPVDELAAMVRSGEVSSRELVQASLDRIDAVNPQVNAFVDVFAEEALAAADKVTPGDERPLAGVPIAIKNNVPIAGKRLTFCSPFMGDFPGPFDHNVVTRLRDDAGAIVVGTTTLPEWGIQPVTETRRFGATRNPWDLDRTPGGSSGGSAAAVASGMVPIAHGNDGGGSIRIPAACCGLVGLKPARGRVSHAPGAGEQFLAIDGVLTRTVRETALALDILAGPVLGDASWAPPADAPFAGAAGRQPGRLKVGVMLDPPLPDAKLDADCVAAVRAAGGLLEQLGHSVEEVTPPIQGADLMGPFTAVFGPMNCSLMFLAMQVHGREPTVDDMERLSVWLWETCRGIDAVSAYSALLQLQATARQIVTWADAYDVLLTPTLATAPLEIGTLDPDREDPAQAFREAGHFTPFTPITNITGQPAISLPLAQHENGLPLGIQLLGRPTDEATLLSLGAQLETAQPWAGRRPALG
jgi:amidase